MYNACVEHRKTSYHRFGKSINYRDQQAALVPFKDCWPEYKALNHGSLQATVKRVDFSFQRFFKGIGGYPRFQSIRKYSGWTYPDARQGFKVHSTGGNGYLELRDLGASIQMRGLARTWGTPTTCTIVYRNGKWYASITVNCEPVRETGTGAVGIDFGVLTAAALSDGTKIENPRFLTASQTKVRVASKAKRRKRSPSFKKNIIGSKRWKKAAQKVAKLQRKVANQRIDWVHKVSTQIVSSNSLVATEKLNLKGMTASAKKRTSLRSGSACRRTRARAGKRKHQKTGLNRSILDVGMGMLRSAIEYKLVEAGGVFVEVPTLRAKPSQTCPNCGHQEKKTLAVRVHDCSKCGLVEDRDVAAAIVMLKWSASFAGYATPANVASRGQELTSQNVDGSGSTSCGSMKQLAQVKRQKRLVNDLSGKLPVQQSDRE